MVYTETMMIRTQILLKDRQYEALKAKARREGKSLSALVRAAVARMLGEEPRGSMRLRDICGLGRDPGGPSGSEHDAVLYGRRKGR